MLSCLLQVHGLEESCVCVAEAEQVWIWSGHCLCLESRPSLPEGTPLVFPVGKKGWDRDVENNWCQVNNTK